MNTETDTTKVPCDETFQLLRQLWTTAAEHVDDAAQWEINSSWVRDYSTLLVGPAIELDHVTGPKPGTIAHLRSGIVFQVLAAQRAARRDPEGATRLLRRAAIEALRKLDTLPLPPPTEDDRAAA